MSSQIDLGFVLHPWKNIWTRIQSLRSIDRIWFEEDYTSNTVTSWKMWSAELTPNLSRENRSVELTLISWQKFNHQKSGESPVELTQIFKMRRGTWFLIFGHFFKLFDFFQTIVKFFVIFLKKTLKSSVHHFECLFFKSIFAVQNESIQ